MTGTDQQQGRVWQPRFYAVCALSVTMMTVLVYFVTPATFATGLMVGYGIASVCALVLLAFQSWSLRPIAQEDTA